MKRILILVILIVTAAAAWSADATLVSVTGAVEVMVPGGSWSAAKAGQVVPVSAMISTGFGARAKVSIGGMEVNVQPLTRITINSLSDQGGTPSSSISLQAGTVRATRPPAVRASAGGVDFRVSTPVATAAVRGTDFVISPNKLKTIEGLVGFTGGDEVVYSPGGTATWFAPGYGPTDPAEYAVEIWSVPPDAGSMPGDTGRGGRSSASRLGWAVITIN